MKTNLTVSDDLVIAGHKFNSRLFLGTGKYRNEMDMLEALKASGCEMITVAIKRLELDNPNKPNLVDLIDWEHYKILSNTAGCTTSEEALLVAQLARELTGSNWIKLEVISDKQYLLPDPIGTLEAAQKLVKDGFKVLPYINADPVLALRLQDCGCSTVMPLGSPIGSGQGALTLEAIAIIIEQANVPVVVDAGLGVPSDAAKVMEIGADAVLVNTAIAKASNPVLMATAFCEGTQAGRKAFLAKRAPTSKTAQASSPIDEAVSL